MENDDNMRRLMEPLLSYILKHVGVTTVRSDSFVPQGDLTENFFQNLKNVFMQKRSIILTRWQKFFENSCLNALSTHEMYLRYVLFACDIEITFSDNIFDKIVTVFALVVSFNIETLINSWVNYCELSLDMFMVFYKSSLKISFYKQGGFTQFANFLLTCHEYLTGKNDSSKDHEVISANFKYKHPFSKYLHYETVNLYDPSFIKHGDIIGDGNCKSLAEQLLSVTKIKFPPLVNSTDLKVRLLNSSQRKAMAGKNSKKCETTTAAPKREATTAAPKRETATAAPKSETTTSAPKGETTTSAPKGETTSSTPKRETTSSTPKRETTSSTPKRETTSSAPKGETTASAPKRETTPSSSKSKTVAQKTIEANFGCNTPKRDSKRKSPLTDWKQTIDAALTKCNTETSALCKTTEASAKCKTIGALSNGETKKTVLQSCTNLEMAPIDMNNFVQQEMTLDWCENVVQKVIKYNNSKLSNPADSTNQIQIEINKFLKEVRDIVEFIINALEDL